MNLIICNACKALKLLNITWIHTCISFNRLIWLIQKNGKIDILSLLFMPFTGNKSPGAKKCSDEWWCDNFTNIFWVKRTFTCCSANTAHKPVQTSYQFLSQMFVLIYIYCPQITMFGKNSPPILNVILILIHFLTWLCYN